MEKRISKDAKREILEVLKERYGRVTKRDKTKIIDEFVAVSGYL